MTALRITWLRTSCLLLEHGDLRVLTDPWFGRTMRGLPVFRKPAIALDDLPRIDVIAASHLHRDHFDAAAVRTLHRRNPHLRVVGTRGTAAFCQKRGLGLDVLELAPWQQASLPGLDVTATPAEHTGPPPPEVNFLLDFGNIRVFFGGDARWSDAYRHIGARLQPIDVALLPIGGTLIFGHRTTMAPADAVRACALLQPRFAVPIHEGGEWLPVPPASWHPGRNTDFAALLASSGVPTQAAVLRPGDVGVFEAARQRGGARARANATGWVSSVW